MHIQRAALPFEELLSFAFDDHFIIWELRDVVGGDIYWCRPIEYGYVPAVADCTGHGVPGAFITLVTSGALSSALSRYPDGDPAALISDMNRSIKEVLGNLPMTVLLMMVWSLEFAAFPATVVE